MAVVVYYANSNKQDIGVLKSFSLDMQLSMDVDNNDFEVKTPIGGIQLDKDYFVYAEGTEYGGIVDKTRIDTRGKTRYYDGRTWRGMLGSKIIVPPANQDYYTVSGDLNDVIDNLVTNFGLDSLFYATETSTGITVTNYQFYRYVDVYSGLMRLLSDKGYKLSIEFDTEQFKCELAAVPIVDYGENQEVTSDLYDFDITQNFNTVNHLIALGSGELKDRMVVNLYADASGNISTTQTFTGTDEIVAIYDYPNVDDVTELTEAATEKFQSLIGSDKIKITLNDINADVGDKLTAYEENTGIEAVQYIQDKVITINDDSFKVQYSAKTIQTSSGGETKSSQFNVDTYYPVGSIYLSVNSTSPAVLFGGTWEQIAQGRTLFGAGTLNNITYTAGETKDAGLPNLSGYAGRSYSDYNKGNTGYNAYVTGPFFQNENDAWGTSWNTEAGNADAVRNIQFDASRQNNIYGNSDTVQPNALVVYMWKRTA